MRRPEALASAAALPFATTAAAMIVTPGYPIAAHGIAIATSVVVAVAAAIWLAIAMKPSVGRRSRPVMAAAWTLAGAVAIVAMVEAVILKPGGIDGRQWAPCGVLAALAALCSVERDGDRVDGFVIARAAAMTALGVGATLAASLAIAAVAGRLSGDDAATAMATVPFLVLVMAPMVQAARADDAPRARLGVLSALMVYLIVVTSVGTYGRPTRTSGEVGASVAVVTLS
jgi:hypothetical protein